METDGMRKALSLTILHNSFANVGDTPVGIGECVGGNSRFVRAIQLFDTEERLMSNVVGVKQVDIRPKERPHREQQARQQQSTMDWIAEIQQP